MVTITITFPDGVQLRVIDGLVGGDEGYQRAIEGDPTPPTKPQYARQVVRELIKTRVLNYEAIKAGDAAHLAARQAAENEIILT